MLANRLSSRDTSTELSGNCPPSNSQTGAKLDWQLDIEPLHCLPSASCSALLIFFRFDRSKIEAWRSTRRSKNLWIDCGVSGESGFGRLVCLECSDQAYIGYLTSSNGCP